jgi:hypothetical protein
MKKIYLSKAITASQLISLGIEVEFDKSNSQMKLAISDKLTLKFNEFREGGKSKKGVEKTSAIIELDYSIENFESPIKYFEIEDKDSAVFEFIKNEIFNSIGVYLKTEQELFDVERDMTIYAMGFHEILYTDTVFNQLKEYIWENELERHCENYLFAVSEKERLLALEGYCDGVSGFVNS